MSFDFSWFTNPETSRALATTSIAALAGLGSAWLASRNVSRTIKNQNKGLPPEILRLEKIQTIIAKHEESTKIFQNIDISDLKGEYEKSLRKLFLETKLSNMGVTNEISRKKLEAILGEPVYTTKFPDFSSITTSWDQKFLRMLGHLTTFLAILSMLMVAYHILLLIFNTNQTHIPSYISEIILFASIIFILTKFSIFIFRGWSINDIENDIVSRNVYQINSNLFNGSDDTVRENLEEFRKRVYFENSLKFKNWIKNNPGKSSWEYGIDSSYGLIKFTPEDAYPEGYTTSSGRFFAHEAFTLSPFPIHWEGLNWKLWKMLSFFPKGKKPQKMSKLKNADRFQSQEGKTIHQTS